VASVGIGSIALSTLMALLVGGHLSSHDSRLL
jgi:hypothetical protein